MSAIPERVWELLTEDERASLHEIIDGWRHEPRIICPNCSAAIGVRLKIAAIARLEGQVSEPSPVIEQAPARPSPTAAAESVFLESAERSGLLKAFVSVVHETKKASGLPTDMSRFFLEFFRGAVIKRVPQSVMHRFNQEFSGNLTFWGCQGILAVSVDGIIRMFVPLSFVVGPPVTSLGTKKMGGRLQSDGRDLDVWVKGRFGYVPLHSENFMDAMKRKNIGQFGALVQ